MYVKLWIDGHLVSVKTVAAWFMWDHCKINHSAYIMSMKIYDTQCLTDVFMDNI